MKKFRSFRNKKKHLSSKYILLILTGVCIVALFTSLVFNLSGGPLKSVKRHKARTIRTGQLPGTSGSG